MIKYLEKKNLSLIEEFLSNLDKDFSENKYLSNSPWKYLGLDHFKFIYYEENNLINSFLVFSIQPNTIHIHFIYTDKNFRGKGITKILLEEMEKYISENIFYITSHIVKYRTLTLEIFIKLGFEQINTNDTKNFYLSNWINKAVKFNEHIFSHKILVAKKIN